jgi:hypothetical protein
MFRIVPRRAFGERDFFPSTLRTIDRIIGRLPSLCAFVRAATKAPTYMSVATSKDKLSIFTRGGNRRTPGAVSYHISKHQAQRVVTAVQRAIDIGLPFNRMVTLHWQKAGLTGAAAVRATGAYIKYLRDWLNGRGFVLSYVWTRENDCGDGSKGDHVHILVYIPKGCELRLQRRWIIAITGKRDLKGVSHTRTVGKNLAAANSQSDDYFANIPVARDYVLKGVHPDTARALGLSLYGEGGRVIGQRCGMSKNLSRAVQTGVIA